MYSSSIRRGEKVKFSYFKYDMLSCRANSDYVVAVVDQFDEFTECFAGNNKFKRRIAFAPFYFAVFSSLLPDGYCHMTPMLLCCFRFERMLRSRAGRWSF